MSAEQLARERQRLMFRQSWLEKQLEATRKRLGETEAEVAASESAMEAEVVAGEVAELGDTHAEAAEEDSPEKGGGS